VNGVPRGIHPSAVIDPAAELAPDVRIGPGVCIEGPVRVGAGCEIQAHAVLTGRVHLGEGNRIGYGAVIGGWPQDFAFDPSTQSGVVLGAGNVIREHCTIHRGTAGGTDTVVGDGCYLMAGAHLGHNTRVGDRAVIANHVLLGGYVEVGERVFIGGASVFHQFVRVGRGAMVQGSSAFSKDVPPFTLAAERNLVFGLNVVGLRRGGLGPEERAEIKAAFKLLYASGMNITQALAAAGRQTWGTHAADFFAFAAAASKRGLCGFGRAAKAAAGE
jgi:UDP-N-acetylglucosamine acyltransferase